ncbi:unnamed protein product, partial [Phaeothamnion confervicola]
MSTRDYVQRMHFHECLSGEGAGRYISHTHDDDAPGHSHEPRRVASLRPDGGYVEALGPSWGAERPPALLAHWATVDAELRAHLAARPTPAHELTVWRLQLYCGCVVERTAHQTHRTIHDAFSG